MTRTQRTLLLAAGAAALVVLGLVGATLGSRETKERQADLLLFGTPVQSISDCPWGEASCVLGLGIERALQLGRVDAVVDFGEPDFYDCPGRPQESPDEPFPLCEGSPEFTRLEGYPVSERGDDRRIVDEDGLYNFIQQFVEAINRDARDEVGDGRLRLYAFGCPERAPPFLNVSCARLAIIVSAIVEREGEERRELMVFWAVGLFGGETLPVTEVWQRTIAEDEWPILFETGGYLEDLGDIYVIDQSARRVAN
jgi:hypothetical protein